jgi:hypothetical protein
MARAFELPTFAGVRLIRRRDEQPLNEQWSAVRTFESPKWLREASDELNSLAQLESNWDSYGSKPPSSAAIVRARIIFSRLNISNHPKPHISAVSPGGVGIHWRIGSRDLEIEVEPDGQISVLQTEISGQMSDSLFSQVEKLQPVLDWVIGI